MQKTQIQMSNVEDQSQVDNIFRIPELKTMMAYGGKTETVYFSLRSFNTFSLSDIFHWNDLIFTPICKYMYGEDVCQIPKQNINLPGRIPGYRRKGHPGCPLWPTWLLVSKNHR